jgi:hypothetical protein
LFDIQLRNRFLRFFSILFLVLNANISYFQFYTNISKQFAVLQLTSAQQRQLDKLSPPTKKPSSARYDFVQDAIHAIFQYRNFVKTAGVEDPLREDEYKVLFRFVLQS